MNFFAMNLNEMKNLLWVAIKGLQIFPCHIIKFLLNRHQKKILILGAKKIYFLRKLYKNVLKEET